MKKGKSKLRLGKQLTKKYHEKKVESLEEDIEKIQKLP
jgi:hypothetical protein